MIKIWIFLVTASSFLFGFDFKNTEPRCQIPKPYAFCGAKTLVGIQWFYDPKRGKCLPYKYCISSLEEEIPENSNQNRFETEVQCEITCSNKPPVKPWNGLSEHKRKLYRKWLKTISNHNQDRNKYAVRQFNESESIDSSRCDKPKSYSFCGSRTSPQIHWYYNQKRNRCLPYTFCETIDVQIGTNPENNFIAEQECNKICVHSKGSTKRYSRKLELLKDHLHINIGRIY